MKDRKYVTVKVVNTYGGLMGSVLTLRVLKEHWEKRDGWNWLSDYQRKRIEKWFGKENAYNCKTYDNTNWEFEIY